MILPRPDLDGLRLMEPEKPDVWLIFRGERHRIVSGSVYDSLFGEVEAIRLHTDVDAITAGPELVEGTCLVRADGGLAIYLVARTERGAVQKHHIPDYETFLDFGFDEAKVRSIPPMVLQGLEEGLEIRSAPAAAAARD